MDTVGFDPTEEGSIPSGVVITNSWKECFIWTFISKKIRKLYQFKKIHSETKHKKLQDDEPDFRELLNKEIHKKK